MPKREAIEVTLIAVDSYEAELVHELWSLWNGGVRDHYIDFVTIMAQLLAQQRVMDLISAATVSA